MKHAQNQDTTLKTCFALKSLPRARSNLEVQIDDGLVLVLSLMNLRKGVSLGGRACEDVRVK